jgi:hypothetical protein
MKVARRHVIDFVSLNHDDDLIDVLKIELRETTFQVNSKPCHADILKALDAGLSMDESWAAKRPTEAEDGRAALAR